MTVSTTRTGWMVRVEVFDGDGIFIGKGHVVTRQDGRRFAPSLTDWHGNELDPGQYELRPVGDGKLITVPMRQVQG